MNKAVSYINGKGGSASEKQPIGSLKQDTEQI